MMSLNEVLEITQEHTIIDDEKVYILDKNMTREANTLKRIVASHDGSSLFRALGVHLDFVLRHQNFAIAFRPIRVKWKGCIEWLPCVVYLFQNEWRRVALQNSHCLKCSWKGKIACPTDPDLYFTMENRFEILRKMGKLPFLKCPLCGNKISSEAIWIDTEEQNTDDIDG